MNSYLHRGALAVALSLTVLAGLLAVACGEAEKPTFEGIPDGATVVDQDGLKFKPDSVTVTAGTTVYFTNSENAVHNVVIDGDDVSGIMDKGDVFAWTFDDPGEYRITCGYHPQMRTTVTVE